MANRPRIATAALIAKVHEILGSCAGNHTKAASILSWEPEQLRRFIHKHESLNACWHSGKMPVSGAPPVPVNVPDNIDALARECALPPAAEITPDERDLAIAVASEETKFKQGLAALRLSPMEQEYALALTNFDRNFFSDTVHMASASAARMSIMMQGIFGDLRARFARVTADISAHQTVSRNTENGQPILASNIYDEQREKMVAEERSLVNHLIEVSEQVKRISELFYKGALVRAAISGKGERRERKLKAGFVNLPPESETGE